MKILRILTIGYCIALLLFPYCYGTVLPQRGFNSPYTAGHVLIPSGHTATNASWLQLIQQGDQYHDNSQYLQAIATYKEALQEYAKNDAKKPTLLAQIYNNMGMSYLALKDYTQTYFCYDKALTIRKKLLERAILSGNEPLKQDISEATGKSHHNLGILYLAMGKPKEAIQSFQAALATEWQHHVEAIDTQLHLTKAYQTQKEFDKAILQPELSAVAASSRTEHKNSIRNWEILRSAQHECQKHSIGNYPSCFARVYQLGKHNQANQKLYEAMLAKKAQQAPYLKSNAVASVEKHLNEVTAKIANTNLSIPRLSTVTLPKLSTPLNNGLLSPPTYHVTRCGTLRGSSHQPVLSLGKGLWHSIVFSHPPLQVKKLPASVGDKNKVPQQENHPQDKPHQSKKRILYCDQCGQSCKNICALTIHMRTHTGEKPFACPICDKRFSQKQNIKIHMYIHTGEKPFVCLVCHKKFSRKENMQIHLRNHTGEKPFACPVCQKKFVRKNTMQKHRTDMHKQ